MNVRTGQEEARKQSNDIKDNLSFLTTALLAFAGISLFVGAFIIFNTFSITVAQRMREFALLRTLGASRGQVHALGPRRGPHDRLRSGRSSASLLGFGGRRAACGRCSAPSASTCRRNGNVIATRTIIVSLVVGTVVTVLSSLAPALRATRVPPVEALREGAVPPSGGPSRKVTAAGALLGLLGVGAHGRRPVRRLSSNAAPELRRRRRAG